MSWISSIGNKIVAFLKKDGQKALDAAKPTLKLAVDEGLVRARYQAAPATTAYIQVVTEYVLSVAKANRVPETALIFLRGALSHYGEQVAETFGNATDAKLTEAADALKKAIDGARL